MDKVLERLVLGQLKSSELPLEIGVWDLTGDFGKIRSLSFDQLVEWGGCIIMDDGLKLTHEVRGRSDGVDPQCEPKDHGCYERETLIHLQVNNSINF